MDTKSFEEKFGDEEIGFMIGGKPSFFPFRESILFIQIKEYIEQLK